MCFVFINEQRWARARTARAKINSLSEIATRDGSRRDHGPRDFPAAVHAIPFGDRAEEARPSADPRKK
jgi:hypothetical protein